MNTLITLGTMAAWSWSVVLLLRGEHEHYFESAALIIAFLVLGRYLEASARGRASAAIRSLLATLAGADSRRSAGLAAAAAVVTVLLGDLGGGLVLPYEPEGSRSVYHIYARLTVYAPDQHALLFITLAFSLVLSFLLWPLHKDATPDRVPWEDSLCTHMVSGQAPRVAPDTSFVPAYRDALSILQRASGS